MRNKSNIGNPAAIYAAAEIANSEQGQKLIKRATGNVERAQNIARKTGKVAAISVITIGAGFLAYKGIKYANKQRLLKKAVSDPEVKTAVDIWNCVPDGYKNKFKLVELNPLNRIGYAYEEIAKLWQSSNTDRIMTLAKRIYDNKYKINRISRVFKTLYEIDLYTLLNKVLTPTQLDVFSNYIYRGSGSVTPQVTAGLYAITKKPVTLRTDPKIPGFTDYENDVKNVGTGVFIGQVTGREEIFNSGSKTTVFVEILAYSSKVNSKKFSTPVWAWKGALDFVDINKARYYSPVDVDVEKSTIEIIYDNNPVKKLYNYLFD